MGIDVFTLNFLLRNRQPSLGRTLCLGRQGVNLSMEDPRVVSVLAEHLLTIDTLRSMTGGEIYAETLFKNLGSSVVESMDISRFEGASVIHDLNVPVRDLLVDTYDCIYDGGTIEHVFNFPLAIDNVKRMLRKGGLYFFINAANNMLGHGLYQFSPELLWRLFSEEAGFSVLDMKLVETEAGHGRFIDAPDPEKMGRRNEISVTQGQTYLMMAARKERDVLGVSDIYQSDYSKAWQDHQAKSDF